MADNKEKSFELAKPMNMVQMNWPKGMTPMQIKTIHVLTIKLKKWIMNTNFKPNPELQGVDAYEGIKTYFEMPLEEFASMMQTSKRSLKTVIKDDEGNTVMFKNFPKLRILEYFEEVQKIQCKVNSPYVTGSLIPVSAAFYDKQKEIVRLETTHSMAVVLQDEAFAKNLSFVDMQLQLSLNSVMASHILDRISRFKGVNINYKCTVGDLIDQCGIDENMLKNRSNFIMVNIKRPLEMIEKKSGGVWERVGTGASVTSKKRGTLLREDDIVFKMKYKAPVEKDEFGSSGWTLPSMDDNLNKMIIHVTGFVTATDDEPYAELSHEYLTKFLKYAQDMDAMKAVGTDQESILKLYFSANDKRHELVDEGKD